MIKKFVFAVDQHRNPEPCDTLLVIETLAFGIVSCISIVLFLFCHFFTYFIQQFKTVIYPLRKQKYWKARPHKVVRREIPCMKLPGSMHGEGRGGDKGLEKCPFSLSVWRQLACSYDPLKVAADAHVTG